MKMDKGKLMIALVMTLLLLGTAAVTVAAVDGYAVTRQVFGGGTARISTGNYTLEGTLGQPATGFTTGGEKQILSGFWATIWSYFRVMLPMTLR